ncbi:MAG: lipopolysaccharide heptosyltransferase I [Acidiferrobacterales bacterium]
MKVLIVKTSSMGDVLHTLPALTDAARSLPGASFHWLVEESFAEIPAWHPAVSRVIPVAMRRWRRGLLTSAHLAESLRMLRSLRADRYDRIIDAQGLLKSAVLAACARGERHGLDSDSAREPLAALFYQHRHAITRQAHAVIRLRQLFAAALDYKLTDAPVDYGISSIAADSRHGRNDYLVFLHGTAWRTKQWPEEYWRELVKRAQDSGLDILLPAGNPEETERAHRIAAGYVNAEVLPRMNLTQIAGILSGARGVIGVDTGLAHCAAALSVPAVTIYGATNPGLTGTLGRAQQHACADFACSPCLRRRCNYHGSAQVKPACYETVPPSQVWGMLTDLLKIVTARSG